MRSLSVAPALALRRRQVAREAAMDRTPSLPRGAHGLLMAGASTLTTLVAPIDRHRVRSGSLEISRKRFFPKKNLSKWFPFPVTTRCIFYKHKDCGPQAEKATAAVKAKAVWWQRPGVRRGADERPGPLVDGDGDGEALERESASERSDERV